jgi:hypothetical protein
MAEQLALDLAPRVVSAVPEGFRPGTRPGWIIPISSGTPGLEMHRESALALCLIRQIQEARRGR